MPKDDSDIDGIKKKPLHDDEDLEFDKEIEESEDFEDPSPTKKTSNPKKEDDDIEDEDPLDREDIDDLEPDYLEAGNKEVFGTNDESENDEPITPKPTFRYNVPPPSEEPTIIPTNSERNLDDLSEEDIAPRQPRPFQVDRGIQPPEDDNQPPINYPRPRAPMPEVEDKFDSQDEALFHIPPIRKQPALYPPHQAQRGYEDPDYQDPRSQSARQPNPYNPYAPDPSQRSGYNQRQAPKPSASKWHIIILLLIGGGVIAATVYLLQNQFNFPGKPAEATPAPSVAVVEATPVPTPTPAPINKADFKVRVLNGTTKPGIAGQVLTKLKDQGYKTDRAGNAPKQDYAQTVIRVKEGNASLSAQLTKDLAPDYNASIQPDLKSTETVEAEIILGLK